MPESSNASDLGGWYQRFTHHLDPAERIGEVLFGLIMVLTFTLGAGFGSLGDGEGTRALLIATLGCNTAWGIIDAALHLAGRLSERGRILRLSRRVQASPSREEALAIVAREFDRRIPSFVKPELRAALDAHILEHTRKQELEANRPTADDALAALAVFWFVFLATLPAALPFVALRDPRIALRVSNGLLIGMLFYSGWRWAGHTGGSRWVTGLLMALLGVGLVGVAIALGG